MAPGVELGSGVVVAFCVGVGVGGVGPEPGVDVAVGSGVEVAVGSGVEVAVGSGVDVYTLSLHDALPI